MGVVVLGPQVRAQTPDPWPSLGTVQALQRLLPLQGTYGNPWCGKKKKKKKGSWQALFVFEFSFSPSDLSP